MRTFTSETKTGITDGTMHPDSAASKPSVASVGARHFGAGLFFAAALFCAAAAMPAGDCLAQARPSPADSLLVESVAVEGDLSMDKGDLLDQLETRESAGALARFLWSISERLPFAGEAQYFDYDIFQRDIESIRRHYTNLGYFSAAVSGEFSRMPDKKAVQVRFLVYAGQRSLVDSVDYRNLQRLPRELDSLIRRGGDRILKPGRPYAAEDTEAEASRIVRLLGDNGYPGAYCEDRTVEIKRSTRNVLVRIPVRYGSRLSISGISRSIRNEEELNLSGKIIDDRLEFKAGDVYSNSRRERSEMNLNRLGIFSDVQITAPFPPITDTVVSSVPLTVELALRKQHDLVPALIVNNQFGRLNGGAEIAHVFRNAFGGAQTLTTKVNFVSRMDLPVNAFQAAAQTQLEQPYFIDNDNSARLAIAYILAREQDLYGGNILQSVVGVTRRFTERTQGTVDWTLEQSKYDILATGQSLVNTPFAPFDTTGINYRNSITGLSLERDLTNDFFNPTEGLYLKGIIEEAGLLKNLLPGFSRGYQSAEYRKIEGLARWFHDLSRNSSAILGVKLRAGALFRYGESKRSDIPVPFNRRYYAGGAQSIRGWSSRALAAGGAEMAKFGGNALVECSMELRWTPFPGRTRGFFVPPQDFSFVFFSDFGNLWNEPSSIRINETAVSMGIGLRYSLFFGPIRIDYGLKAYDPGAIDRNWFHERKFWDEVLRKGQIHLGIGHSF